MCKKYISIALLVIFVLTLASCGRKCDTCKYDGVTDCFQCGGTGNYSCPICGGSGTVTNDAGSTVDCAKCVDGKVDCPLCTNGKLDCPDCDRK